MSTRSQKRALPPTPTTSTKYTNVNDAIQSLLDTSDECVLTERERRWYNDLSNCQKTLEQKDSTINNLKTIVMEWKKKAIEYENSYKETLQRLEDREQFLIKQHKAEIQALTKVQVDQTNDNLDIIIQLEKENHYLRRQCQIESYQQQQQLPNSYYRSTTTQLCNNAEIANKQANELVSSSKENSNELIQRINEMVSVMEGTLHDLKYNSSPSALYHREEEEEETPALISDSSSCCSSSSSDNEDSHQPQPIIQAQAQQQPVINNKKKRSSTIPNFLFRNSSSKKEAENNIKRNLSFK